MSTTEILALLPEIWLLIVVCAALIVPVLPPLRSLVQKDQNTNTLFAFVGVLGALVFAIGLLTESFGLRQPTEAILHGMAVVDPFALTVKIVIYAFTLMVLLLWTSTTRSDVRIADGPDYVSLVLCGLLGMSLMASATNFLMVFLAIESASFPSYALAGFNKRTARSSEASLKYVLFGAASSALMLYGLSMLYGQCGTLDVAGVSQVLAVDGMSAGILLGIFGFLVGIGFKLSAVPVHFWCPDVFEGASIEITTFLSVASKGGAIALLLRVMMTLGHYTSGEEARSVLVGIGTMVGIVGVATATWGNLAAYFQDNIKRLLAYSSIAHAGYMVMLAGLLTASMDFAQPAEVAYALAFYLVVYAFMNMGAFTVAAVVARQSGSESLSEYGGLGKRNIVLAVAMGVFLLSLFGMPLTGGFWGKVRFGFAMWDEGMWWLVAALVINTVFSLYFYLKPIIIMVWKQPAHTRRLEVSPVVYAIVGVCFLGVFATGLLPDRSTGWAQRNVEMTFAPMPSRAIEVTAGAEQSEAPLPERAAVMEGGQ